MSAIAALKGYRTQFLYSLHYILSHKDKNYQFRLEGEEDLDILDAEGNILFAIQVKNMAKSISISDLISNKKTSFLMRFLNNYNTSIPILISYGPINADLLKWKSAPSLLSPEEKSILTKYGLSTQQWRLIKEKIIFEKVDEGLLSQEILHLLKAYQSIDPVPTAENLLYWLQNIAEKQQVISAFSLLQVIERMAVYLSERISFAKQYGLYIKPLHLTDFNAIDMEKLKEEFYSGTSARYEHIYFSLDVIRNRFLDKIKEIISRKNIVILHGASGQGKSTLAYRYAFGHAPGALIYEVNLQDDTVKTIEAIIAMSGMTKNLNIPLLFILHVTPNTTEWLKVVKEFSNHAFVRMLVTVRSEDWYRAQSAEIDFQYGEVELELTQEEAGNIFESLEKRQLIKQYADFKEAWIDLNESVPLLEFIYAITQGASLANRLKKQIEQLQIEENNHLVIGQLDFLKILSLSDSFGARIDIEKVKALPDIKRNCR